MTGRSLPRFWNNWLIITLLGTMLCSLLPLVAPASSLRLISVLALGRMVQVDAFPADAVRYIGFVNAVLGAVMLGWAVALLFIVAGPLRRCERWAWHAVALSLSAWFVPGTLFSAWSGAMLNVAVNVLFIVAFAIPLIATYRLCRANAVHS